jgi:hypothetical protein
MDSPLSLIQNNVINELNYDKKPSLRNKNNALEMLKFRNENQDKIFKDTYKKIFKEDYSGNI